MKIITIEDPVEYHCQGITQTQVNDKGYTFLEGLRAAVRQDPDIIMVGEIRDDETADIAINSALTGPWSFQPCTQIPPLELSPASSTSM